MKKRKLRLAALAALALKVVSLFTGCSIDADEKNNSTTHGQVKESSSIVETYQQEIEKCKIEVKRDSITVSNVPVGTKLTLKNDDGYEVRFTASDKPKRFEHLKPGKYYLSSELGLSNETIEVEVPYFYPYDTVGILSNLDSNAVEKIIYTTDGADNPFITPYDDEQKYVLADIKYLPDGTCTIGVFTDSKIEYPVNYSPTIDGAFEADYLIEGVNPEEDAEKYLLPLLDGKHYLTDVFEKDDSYKTATLYSENHVYTSAKVCYSYNDDGKINKTEYYDEYGFMYMSEDQREDNGIRFSVQTWYNRDTKEKEEEIWKSLDNNNSFTRKFYTTKNGFKYEITDDLWCMSIRFYNQNGEVNTNSKNKVSVNKVDDSIEIVDGENLKVLVTSNNKTVTYTVNSNGEIIPIDKVDLTERIDRVEQIYDRTEENPIAQIEYYEEIYKTESIQGKHISSTRPSKTIISSKYLDEPITINYTYKVQGDGYTINSRENQIMVDGAPQYFVAIYADTNWYIDWIKEKHTKNKIENDNYKFNTIDYHVQSKVFKYSPTGTLERETILVNGTPVLDTNYSYLEGLKSISQMHYENGEPVLLERYSPDGVITSTYEYLKAENGCSYVDHHIPETGVHHFSFNDSAGHTTLDIISGSDSVLTKYDGGNYLVIDLEYPDGARDIYEIDSNGTLAYRTIIIESNAGKVIKVCQYIGDKMVSSREYDSQEFNIQKFLPWSKDYDDSWEKLAKDNDGLFYTENIISDTYLQTSTRAYPDGEVTTWEPANETHCEGVQHTLTRL